MHILELQNRYKIIIKGNFLFVNVIIPEPPCSAAVHRLDKLIIGFLSSKSAAAQPNKQNKRAIVAMPGATIDSNMCFC